MTRLKTSCCIWVTIPVDWVISHWHTCGADGTRTVTLFPNFLGCIDNQIFLLIVLRCSQTAPRPLSSFNTHARWQPVTRNARSRRSHGKIGDCEQSTARALLYYWPYCKLINPGNILHHSILPMVASTGKIGNDRNEREVGVVVIYYL